MKIRKSNGNADRDRQGHQGGTAAVLSLDEVGRTYVQGKQLVRALGPLSLEVGPGEFVAIMGPSGSGKSTLLTLAGALDRPTEGRVSVLGTDLAGLDSGAAAEMRRRVIGFVFQDLNLLPGLTALENVTLPLELDGVPLKQARAEAEEALAGVRMAGFAGRFPDDLSGGEQQRVAVARAFVGSRTLLLADEPTGALDSVTGELVMRLLRSHCDRGRTVVLVTHDSSHAAWADRVVFLADGRIVDQARSRPPFKPTILRPEP